MRVSKADGSQSTNLQRDALIAAGVSLAHLYEDLASGRRDDRPGLEASLKALREGDTLIVWKLDRLGRNLRHLVNTIHDLMEGGICFRVPDRARRQYRHHDRQRPAGVRDFRLAPGCPDPRKLV